MRGVVVHRSPAWFMVDGGKKTLEPVGMKGTELKALVSFVVADTFFLDDVMARLQGYEHHRERLFLQLHG